MKNYIVKAIRNFNDVAEKNEYGLDTPRTAEVSIWNCTKERYEFLKQNKAVVLMGIEEVKEEKKIPVGESVQPIEKDNNTIEMEVSFDSKKTINKVNEIKNNGGTYEEVVKEVEKIIDETIKVKPKKKTSKK